jgi:chromosomal replication initiation ATPase DnaA
LNISDPGFWPRCLEQLALNMQRATYDAYLKNSTARPENGHLLILIDTPLKLDWVQGRLQETVKRAVEALAEREIALEFGLQSEARETAQQPELFFTGTFKDLYNEIVQPGRAHYTSWYFHKYWLPILGPDTWLLIWELRTRCWRDKETGKIVRDTVEADYKDLAKALGTSERTMKRLLNPRDPEKKANLEKLILDRKTKRRYSKRQKGTVNQSTIFKIALDDPLTPEHELQFQDFSKCQNGT